MPFLAPHLEGMRLVHCMVLITLAGRVLKAGEVLAGSIAVDTNHNGYPLRSADKERISRCRERLPDKLVLKVEARVL